MGPPMRYNLFIGVDKMCVKNITVTVSVRVSVTVRVSLVLFVSSNTFGVAICRRCVYKIIVAFAQRCVYNKSACILHLAVYIISGFSFTVTVRVTFFFFYFDTAFTCTVTSLV